jgi:phage terminase large subunit
MEINIRPNQVAQSDFLSDFSSKECMYLGGYGSGKSYSLYRKHLVLHMKNATPSLIVAPTYSDLFRVSVPNLQSALDEWGIRYKTFPNGQGALKFPYIDLFDNPIYLISGAEPHRLVGFEVGCAGVDECARLGSSDIPMLDVPNLIRARIRHPKATIKQINWATTPEGTNSWCYRDFIENKTKERSIYIGSTVKNNALPQDYIESLKSSYSSRLQDAYLHGQFINASANLQFWAFDRKYVTSSDFVAPNEGKAFIGIDENVSPLSMLWGRYTKDRMWFAGEVQIKDNANVLQLTGRYSSDDKRFDLFGDSSINRRNTIGERFIDVFIKEMKSKGYQITDRVNKANFDIFSSAECVNNCFEKNRIRIHPNCKQLIKDLENAQYKPGTLETLKSNGADPHMGDIIRYCVFSEFRPGTSLVSTNKLF